MIDSTTKYFTITAQFVADGKLVKIEFAEGVLSYEKVGEFWLPPDLFSETLVPKYPKAGDIIEKRIKEIMNIDKRTQIHVGYYTGVLRKFGGGK